MKKKSLFWLKGTLDLQPLTERTKDYNALNLTPRSMPF